MLALVIGHVSTFVNTRHTHIHTHIKSPKGHTQRLKCGSIDSA